MRRNRRSSFARIAALLVASISGALVISPERTYYSTSILPCEVIPAPGEPLLEAPGLLLALPNPVFVNSPVDCI